MTRARQVANFDPALFAADEVSGDKVSSGTIGGDTIINTSGAITTTGGMTVDGATVFNEASADVDFRVESNGNANMLFVDASADKVGIGTATPENILHCESSGDVFAQIESTDNNKSGIKFIRADAGQTDWMTYTTGGNLYFSSDADLASSANAVGTTRMIINSSGNVGIGVTPKAWHGGTDTAVQFGQSGAIFSRAGADGPSNSWTNNFYWTSGGSAARIMAGYGSKITQSKTGTIIFYTGETNATADTTITMTSRLNIANDGTFTGSGSANISDERLKENITTIPDALQKINALTGRTFTWKDEANMQIGTQYGLIAQELETVIPDLVYNENGIRLFDKDNNLKHIEDDEVEVLETDEYAKSITMTGLIPILVEAVKELSAKVTALENA